MIPINFIPPPPPRGDTQQQLNDLRRWAEDLTNSLREMAADLEVSSTANNP